MSSLWASTACQACRSPRRVQVQPLLQLFNGYARYSRSARTLRDQSTVSKAAAQQQPTERRTFASLTCSPNPIRERTRLDSRTNAHFTTSAILSARKKKKQPASLESTAASIPLEPAPTRASHTEGLEEEDRMKDLTWRDFDPAGGMPLPGGELSAARIEALFEDKSIDEDTGNYILDVMYWRRQSGALIDVGLDFPKDSGVTRAQALRGLEYVRTLEPEFDEGAAGEVWAQEETMRLREQLQERAFKLGIYKREVETDGHEEDEEVQQGSEYGRSRSGTSELEKHRREREAQRAKEEADAAVKKEREETAALYSQRGPLELEGGVQPAVALTTTGAGGITIGQPPTKAWLAPVERKEWVKYYEKQAQVLQDNMLPQLSLASRLLPALLTTLVVIGLAMFVSDNYTPPPKSARLFPDVPPAVATLSTVTAAIATIFVLSRLPPFWSTLSKYFTIVPAYPRAISVLGSMLRHDTLRHMVPNLLVLWPFGLMLHDDVGRGTFLAIFIASGAIGGFASLSYQVLRQRWTSYVFGASGGVLGVVAASCLLHPNNKLKVAGYEIPIAAWCFLAILGTAEIAATVLKVRTNIDHAGHAGGIIAGAAAAAYLRARATSQGQIGSSPLMTARQTPLTSS